MTKPNTTFETDRIVEVNVSVITMVVVHIKLTSLAFMILL